MREVCIQFQPDRAKAHEAQVRNALHDALPFAKVTVGKEEGRYENFLFHAVSPEAAIAALRAVLDSAEIGLAARSSCIVTCQGKHGWDDFLLLHHFDSTLILDAPAQS